MGFLFIWSYIKNYFMFLEKKVYLCTSNWIILK